MAAIRRKRLPTKPKEGKVKNYKLKKADATKNKQEIVYLEKKLNVLEQKLKPTYETLNVYNEVLSTAINSSQNPTNLGAFTPDDQKWMLGINHATAMKDLATANEISFEQFMYHGTSIKYQIKSAGQPLPVQFTVMLCTLTKLGVEQRGYGVPTSGMDYYKEPSGKVRMNKDFWIVRKRQEFEIGHTPFLTSTPATNVNTPIRNTIHRGEISHYFKKPKLIKVGDTAGNVWELGSGEYPNDARVQLFVFHNNGSAAPASCEMDYVAISKVTVGT